MSRRRMQQDDDSDSEDGNHLPVMALFEPIIIQNKPIDHD